MFRVKRIWPAIMLSLAAWLLPAKGYCKVDDPYAYKSLLGRITFEYERNNAKQDDIETESSSFLQRYSLDAKGYLLNRRLIIYDAGWAYQNDDYSSDTSELNTSTTNLYLRTTMLPLSSIPLTLYGRRNSNTLSTREGTDVETVYGLEWDMRFRTLPETYLMAERDQKESGDGFTTTTDKYRVELKKDLGPTQNILNYYLSNSDSGGPESSQYTVNFINSTKVSRSTHFSLGAVRSVSEPADEPVTTLHGASLSLRSAPSKDFYQTHSYNYYSKETDGDTQEGTSYSGRMSYDISKRLYSALSLNVNNTTSETGSSTTESNSLSSSASVRYRISNELNLLQTASYSKTDTNSSDPTANVADRERLSTHTALSYAKILSWAQLSTGAGLGYTDEKSQSEEAGQGLDQSFYLSLSDIDLNKYVGAATSYNYANTTTISGDNIDSTSQAYTLSLYNKVWRQYAVATGSYALSTYKSHTMLLEEKKEKVRAEAESTYFKDTRFKAFAEYSKTFQEITGEGEALARGFSAKHERDFFKGFLGLSAAYSITDSTFEGGSDSVSLTQYNLSYTRRLIRNMTWQAFLQRTEQETSNSLKNTTLIKNMVFLPLRSWDITAEHEYKITEDPGRELTENSIFFRATRAFMRIW